MQDSKKSSANMRMLNVNALILEKKTTLENMRSRNELIKNSLKTIKN